uniref:Uncharacterized protein n=1 Tax=uncultured marine virus TaxID=186617 RepID=A0A0F7L7W9_9VIRU|nr:hypothetical protein [uncultured marine virus]
MPGLMQASPAGWLGTPVGPQRPSGPSRGLACPRAPSPHGQRARLPRWLRPPPSCRTR